MKQLFLEEFGRCSSYFVWLALAVTTLCVGCGRHVSEEDESVVTPPGDGRGGHARMVQTLAEIASRADDHDHYTGTAMLRNFRARVSRGEGEEVPGQRSALLSKLAQMELIHGHEEDSIRLFEESLSLLESLPESTSKAQKLARLRFLLAVACLRLGETENCCLRHSPESCILPVRGAGIHSETVGSEAAVRHLTEVLPALRSPSQMGPYLEARWLLNLASMTLGKFPLGVPAEYRIPEAAFADGSDAIPEHHPGRLRNIAQSVGIDTFDLAGSAVVDDFTGDGFPDVFFTAWDPRGQLRFFVNEGGERFVEKTEEAGLLGLFGGLNALQADYDNDGDADLLVLRGAWRFKGGRIPNSLLENDGKGTFRDVTFAAGLGETHYPTQTAAWADYDLDGDLDLYVGNESTTGIVDFGNAEGFARMQSMHAPSQLFRNNGNGTFTDVAAEAGVENHGYAKGVVWGDYDRDRFPDLYVSNYRTDNRLYRNNGDGTFTDVAKSLQVVHPQASFPTWFWDFDNDGHLDLFVGSFAGKLDDVVAASMGATTPKEGNRLYRGDGAGGFTEVAREMGIHQLQKVMGANFGDVNGDGFADVYMGTGAPPYKMLIPNRIFLNESGSRFLDASYSTGLAHLQKGHGVAFADWDSDGDLDVFHQIGGAFPGDRYPNALFENPGSGGDFLSVELIGVTSNRSAIGTEMTLVLEEKTGGVTRKIVRHVNSGGSFGANPLRQFFGFRQSEALVRLEIFWPATGQTERHANPPRNAWVRIHEGASTVEIVREAEK